MRAIALNPVVFTDGEGPFGADELHAPYFPAVEQHQISHNLGTFPVMVWVTLADNIPDIKAIHSIIVSGWDNDSILLQVSAQPGQVGRVRLQVYALSE